MSKQPPSADTERTRERKRRQRMSQPHVTTPIMSQPAEKIIANAKYVTDHRGDGSPQDVPPLQAVIPHRTAGKTPEESGYLEGQVEVHQGPQGQVLWRLRGHYDLPNKILCDKA